MQHVRDKIKSSTVFIHRHVHALLTFIRTDTWGLSPTAAIEAYALSANRVRWSVPCVLKSAVGRAGKCRNRAMELSIEGSDPSGDRGDGGEGHGGQEGKRLNTSSQQVRCGPWDSLARP